MGLVSEVSYDERPGNVVFFTFDQPASTDVSVVFRRYCRV